MLDAIRRSRAYTPWRLWRERQQVRRFQGLLAGAGAAPWGDPFTRAALAERRAARRQLPVRPRIAAFGTGDWEDKGFWQAFAAAGDLALFDYAHARRQPPSAGRRAALGREFLAFVEAREREAPVQVAFLYAAGTYLDPAMLASLAGRGIWTVVMSLDDKQQLPGDRAGDLMGWQVEAARAADLYWTTWRSGADWLWAHGARPLVLAEGASPDFFAPRPVARDLPVVWVGRAYGPRFALVAGLRRAGFPVATFGPGWPEGPVPFERMVELYSRAQVVLGMGGVGQTDRIKHLKGRDFEVPMAGACYLTSFNPELAEHFDIGREVLCYASPEECADQLAWALRHPEDLERIRAAARARCLRDHRWDQRVATVLSTLRGG